MSNNAYIPPEVWKWDQESGGTFSKTNRPTAGPTHEKKLPVGKHPLQLYSLATPNGVKITVMLEELLALVLRVQNMMLGWLKLMVTNLEVALLSLIQTQKSLLLQTIVQDHLSEFLSLAQSCYIWQKNLMRLYQKPQKVGLKCFLGCFGKCLVLHILEVGLDISMRMHQRNLNIPSIGMQWKLNAN